MFTVLLDKAVMLHSSKHGVATCSVLVTLVEHVLRRPQRPVRSTVVLLPKIPETSIESLDKSLLSRWPLGPRGLEYQTCRRVAEFVEQHGCYDFSFAQS